ncbi:hypothetical protein HZU40_18320 [Mycolicibacterium fluoranthenivorans]|uniref:Uncharacterized protein n=2 Tax=Mycolicibacterium fluoranthenivorans TaxID=258505 RepID=A0A7G8P7C6_9MYCO|nr:MULTISPECIES: hypothetical protein [Mycobacteriaceae]MCV7256629.1 hypothetical protein [Mycobacterium hackensackense]QNJ90242.1 hypothetical protein HZU40_18320 [Mycolicibacterium fluoranthenivorans]
MTGHMSPRERALRTLSAPYSLGLRLREAGVAPEVICDYLDVELDNLDAFYRLADAKLAAAESRIAVPKSAKTPLSDRTNR